MLRKVAAEAITTTTTTTTCARLLYALVVLVILADLKSAVSGNSSTDSSSSGRGKNVVRSVEQIDCLENEQFYRNELNCSLYYLCIEDEVFEFQCSKGLFFNSEKQVCEEQHLVSECHTTASPSVNEPQCNAELFSECANGQCIRREYLCDGAIDCSDASDENHCASHSVPEFRPARCDPQHCRLPSCFCLENETSVPSRLNTSDIPQMVILTFDSPVNNKNWKLFSDIIFARNRTNPNACPIAGTFFVSHQNSNYYYVHELWKRGHEIASYSITQRKPEKWWSENATLEDWFDEMIGQANILNKFAEIPLRRLHGVRAPYLQVGQNRQFLMMQEFGFLYDNSIVAPFTEVPYWPFTLKFKLPFECFQQNCPTRSYPDVWEMVINQVISDDFICTTIDSCPSYLNGSEIYEILVANFQRHFFNNRAPISLHFNSKWFRNPDYLFSFLRFLDDLLEIPEVWFVTNRQAIEWIKSPKTLAEIGELGAWNCEQQAEAKTSCAGATKCSLGSAHSSDLYNMTICSAPCPDTYPWVKNEFGLFAPANATLH